MQALAFQRAGRPRARPLLSPWRSSGAAAAPNAPGYLASTVAPYAAYGAQRVVAGYAGALFRVRRSDATELDVSAATGGDYPDYAALATWAGSSAITVPVIYDQSGNARHLSQSTVANQPSLDLAFKTGNVAPILIDGQANTVATGALVTKTPQVGSLSLDVTSASFFVGYAANSTQNSNGVVELLTEDGVTSNQAIFIGGQLVTGRTTGTNIASSVAGVPRASREVIGMAADTAQVNIYAGGTRRQSGQAKTSTAVQRIRFGTSTAGGTGYNGRFKLFAAAFYNSTVSTANGDAIVASIKTAIGTPATYDYRVVFDGDSIMEGTGSTLLRNMVNQIVLTKNAEIYNTAVHGQTMATIYGARVTRFSPLYTSAIPSVIFIEAGINDITTGTTGANLYANSTSPLITYLKGLGYKVVVATLLPFTNSTNYTSGRETERLAYNSAVIGNAAGADLVLDLASNATMGVTTAPADTTLYVDKLHPTTLGYSILAPLYQAALQTVLRTTALGGSYVP